MRALVLVPALWFSLIPLQAGPQVVHPRPAKVKKAKKNRSAKNRKAKKHAAPKVHRNTAN